MSYFAILWKTPRLSFEELQLIWPTNIHRKWKIVVFELSDNKTASLNQLAGIIKRGKIVKLGDDDFLAELKWLSIAGVSERKLWMTLKKKYGVRRFKEIEIEKSDLEIKNEGKEFIDLDEFAEWMIGIVSERQDIKRFEVIDFDKPVRGMKIGMMPGKLTQMLVNIGIASLSTSLKEGDVTIYDPFSGFWTTGFVVNSLGHHFIGSDINITPGKQNKKRWLGTKYAQENKHFTLFKHNVNNRFTKPFLKQVDVIVSEWRLWPILKERNHLNKEQQYQEMMGNIEVIVTLYTSFLENAKMSFAWVPIIITVPVYLALPAPFVEERITEAAKKMWYTVEQVWEVYKRKKQNIGRRVLRLECVE